MIRTNLENVESAAQQLNDAERTPLAESPSGLQEEDEILAAWAEECERRADAFERGEISAIDFDEAIAQSRVKLAARNVA